MIHVKRSPEQGNYLVRPTQQARAAFRAYRLEKRLEERAEPVDLSWGVVRPTLVAIVEVFERNGASRMGYVSSEAVTQELGVAGDDLQVLRAAQALEAQDLIEIAHDEDEDLQFRPQAGGIRAIKGDWPGSEGQVDRVIAALATVLDQTEDPDERGRLKRALDGLRSLGLESYGAVAGAAASAAASAVLGP